MGRPVLGTEQKPDCRVGKSNSLRACSLAYHDCHDPLTRFNSWTFEPEERLTDCASASVCARGLLFMARPNPDKAGSDTRLPYAMSAQCLSPFECPCEPEKGLFSALINF